jgi:hypothetical protein
MIRLAIVVVAAVLVAGGVGVALSGARDPDPGPAILLDEAPTAGVEIDADDAAERHSPKVDGGDQRVDARSDADPFTVVHPLPVEADQPAKPDASDQPAASDEDDEPDKPEEADKPDKPEEAEED